MTDYRGMMEGLGGPVRMDQYSLSGIDPTLDACCQREVESNRRYNALTSTLRRHDVVALAERRRRNLVKTPDFDGCRCCYDPNSDGGSYMALIEYREQRPVNNDQTAMTTTMENLENVEPNADQEKNRDDDSDSDSEFDYLLDEDLPGDTDNEGGVSLKELEENRRAELEYQMLERLVAQQHGYGVHRQIHPGRVLKCAGLGDKKARQPPPAVVLHLFDPESVSSASLDHFLDTELASKFPGTIYLRGSGRTTLSFDASIAEKSFPQLKMDQLPALLAIKDGSVVNICPKLREFVDNTNENLPVATHAVESWLQYSGVLLPNPPSMDELCFIRPEEEALMDYLATKKPQAEELVEEERYDCGIEGCNKSFFHEHVGVQTAEQSGLVVKEETVLGDEPQTATGV